MKEKDIAMMIRTASIALGRIAEIIAPLKLEDDEPLTFTMTAKKKQWKAGKRAYTKKSAFWKNPVKKRGRPAKK